MVRICVIALVGLPASGKTTFCKTFIQSFGQYDCIHVCYDQIFTFKPHENVTPYKENRRRVLQEIEQIVDRLTSNENPDWRSSDDHIVICDDNNYYAGMRYEIYRLCKNRQLAFGQIYFPLKFCEALERNHNRNPMERLPDNVIEHMQHRLESPSPKNKWEKNTFTFRSPSDLNDVQFCLESWIASPLDKPCKRNDESQHFNVVHQVDILLRKRIRQLLHGFDGDLSERAKTLNEMRKSILRDLVREKPSDVGVDVDSIVKRLK